MVIDFCACYVDVMTECCTAENVQSGCIKNSMLDPIHKRLPTRNGILSTCKRDISVEEFDNVKEDFDSIFDSFEG